LFYEVILFSSFTWHGYINVPMQHRTYFVDSLFVKVTATLEFVDMALLKMGQRMLLYCPS